MTPVIVSQERRRERVRRALNMHRLAGVPLPPVRVQVDMQPWRCPVRKRNGRRCILTRTHRATGERSPHLFQ